MLCRLQKMLCATMIALLLLSMLVPALAEGADSNATAILAYANRNTYVYRYASTASERRAVALNTGMYVIGRSGSFSKVRSIKGNATGFIKTDHLSRSKTDGGWKSKVVKMSWFGSGCNVLRRGGYAYIYDIDTGISLRIKRMGGTYHADVEPATAADTAKLLRVARGRFSWDSHAVILYANGKYIACGINTLPHGSQTILDNNYNGQFCLHMTGSLTHCSSRENVNHQASIRRAYNWAHR